MSNNKGNTLRGRKERLQQIFRQIIEELDMSLAQAPALLTSPQAAQEASLYQIFMEPIARALYYRGLKDGRTATICETRRALETVSVFPRSLPGERTLSFVSAVSITSASTGRPTDRNRQSAITCVTATNSSLQRVNMGASTSAGTRPALPRKRKLCPSDIRRREYKRKIFLERKENERKTASGIAVTTNVRSLIPLTGKPQTTPLPLITPPIARPQTPVTAMIRYTVNPLVIPSSTPLGPPTGNDISSTPTVSEEEATDILNDIVEAFFSCPTSPSASSSPRPT
ncbi:uncharacterized protein LOC126896113 [Daktulosphaira vitifoliae]|uniref:uncharacterized protein LOC126896113 n=1 Tax=Daktulosphaira vitifoliae TaxID=58002 RepID=UPI0021A97B3A|nr:uncharacterized protein LOC126896113 [Daktulosphaira vitifoliae]XP_050524555.1 uncharacterized protein LOC126896113 [Daktulosphaira vitifoliae]